MSILLKAGLSLAAVGMITFLIGGMIEGVIERGPPGPIAITGLAIAATGAVAVIIEMLITMWAS